MWVDDTGPSTITLIIKYSVPGPVAELWLEEETGEKRFGKLSVINGTANAGVVAGTYSLNARGKTNVPNAAYTIEITAPAAAAWKPNPARTSDNTASIDDLHQIIV